jgi:hypothetical protein
LLAFNRYGLPSIKKESGVVVLERAELIEVDMGCGSQKGHLDRRSTLIAVPSITSVIPAEMIADRSIVNHVPRIDPSKEGLNSE